MGEYYMAKSSLYAAHRAAGAASGRYKASLYDIANVGYAMEADIGIEQHKESKRQEGYETLQAAISLADTIYGGFESKKKHEEMMGAAGIEKPSNKKKSFYGEKAGFDIGDIWGEKSIWKGKAGMTSPSKTTPSKTTTQNKPAKKVPTIGLSKDDAFTTSTTNRVKAVGEAFRQAKETGTKEGSTIFAKIGDSIEEILYKYK